VLGRSLYTVGDMHATYNTLSSVKRYDEEKDGWEAVVDMSTARFGTGACVHVGYTFACSWRLWCWPNNLSFVKRYGEKKDDWEAVADMSTGVARDGPGVAARVTS